MSETEKFYASVVSKLGGARTWNELHPMEQHQFIGALNIILGLCSSQ